KNTTSKAPRFDALIADRSSVADTRNSPAADMSFMTCRAVAIESWRNPAVAVSINTRIADSTTGLGAVAARCEEHAAAMMTRSVAAIVYATAQTDRTSPLFIDSHTAVRR